MMFVFDLNLVLAVFLSICIFIFIGIQFFQFFSSKYTKIYNQSFRRKCPYCFNIFYDHINKDVSKCPRCESLIQISDEGEGD